MYICIQCIYTYVSMALNFSELPPHFPVYVYRHIYTYTHISTYLHMADFFRIAPALSAAAARLLVPLLTPFFLK
jgi:hypothetical protein